MVLRRRGVPVPVRVYGHAGVPADTRACVPCRAVVPWLVPLFLMFMKRHSLPSRPPPLPCRARCGRCDARCGPSSGCPCAACAELVGCVCVFVPSSVCMCVCVSTRLARVGMPLLAACRPLPARLPARLLGALCSGYMTRVRARATGHGQTRLV